jgi:acetyl esterase/lipase
VTEHLAIAQPYEVSTDVVHPIDAADLESVDQIRAAAAAGKGRVDREALDAMMEQTPDAAGITYELGTVGDVSGIWCRPSAAAPGRAILYLHGGAYIAGSAEAFRHLAGQIAARAGAPAFVPDYRLAPEHRFPAAFDDVHAAYRGIVERETRAVAIVGDSAGGGLALALIASTCAAAKKSGALAPCAGVAMSPWTDLALRGLSLESRAEADPFLTKAALARAAAEYLARENARTPQASPLYGDLRGLPPLRLHTGTDEILLDDSRRYAQNARAANVDIALHLWEGMPHVFATTVGSLNAATQALDLIGTFLRERLDVR